MAKRKTTTRRRSTKKPTTVRFESQDGPTFDLDAIVLIGAMTYNIRETVEKLAIEKAKGKNPVSLSAVKSAITSLRLTKYIEDIEEEDQDEG